MHKNHKLTKTEPITDRQRTKTPEGNHYFILSSVEMASKITDKLRYANWCNPNMLTQEIQDVCKPVPQEHVCDPPTTDSSFTATESRIRIHLNKSPESVAKQLNSTQQRTIDAGV